MLKYIAEKIGANSSYLVVFLHGYNGCIEDHSYAIDWLKKYLHDSILIVPQAPEICDKNASKKQWFGMLKYDADNLRYKQDLPAEQIFEIYERAQKDVAKCAVQINDFVAEMQKKYRISPDKTFLIGFSQGAMLALYSALSAKNIKGGVFALSGLLAGAKKLSDEICSAPPVYLFHGKEDNKVQYKTLQLTQKWFENHNIKTAIFSYEKLPHKMCEDEMIKICEAITKTAAE